MVIKEAQHKTCLGLNQYVLLNGAVLNPCQQMTLANMVQFSILQIWDKEVRKQFEEHARRAAYYSAKVTANSPNLVTDH